MTLPSGNFQRYDQWMTLFHPCNCSDFWLTTTHASTRLQLLISHINFWANLLALTLIRSPLLGMKIKPLVSMKHNYSNLSCHKYCRELHIVFITSHIMGFQVFFPLVNMNQGIVWLSAILLVFWSPNKSRLNISSSKRRIIYEINLF